MAFPDLIGKSLAWLELRDQPDFESGSSITLGLAHEAPLNITNPMHSFDGFGEVGSLILSHAPPTRHALRTVALNEFAIHNVRVFFLDHEAQSVITGVQLLSHAGRDICVFSHPASCMLSAFSSEFESRFKAEHDVFSLRHQLFQLPATFLHPKGAS